MASKSAAWRKILKNLCIAKNNEVSEKDVCFCKEAGEEAPSYTVYSQLRVHLIHSSHNNFLPRKRERIF